MIIDRHHSNYSLIRCREKPDSVKRKLDNIASTLLLHELEHKLAQVLDNGKYVFIRDITVNCQIDLSRMDGRTIAHSWADQICAGIADKIMHICNTGIEIDDTAGIAIFPCKAVYYAHFIRDRIDGTAQYKWYYRHFQGMESIGMQEMFKLLFEQAADVSYDVLFTLDELGMLEKLLHSLTEETAREIFTKYLIRAPRTDMQAGSRTYGIGAEAINRFLQSSGTSKHPQSYKQCLKSYVLIRKTYPGLRPDSGTADIIEDLIIKRKPPARHARRKKEKSSQMPDKKGVEIPLEQEISGQSEEFRSCYGGLFLLFPAAARIKLHEVITQSIYPVIEYLSPIQYLFALLALKIVRIEVTAADWIDPGICLFAGMDTHKPINALQHIGERVTTEMNEHIVEKLLLRLSLMKEQSLPCLDYVNLDDLRRCVQITNFDSLIVMIADLVLRVFARDLRGFEESSPGYVLRNFIERESTITVTDQVIHIDLAQKPLDTILRLSGLLDRDIRVPWLENKTIDFTLKYRG